MEYMIDNWVAFVVTAALLVAFVVAFWRLFGLSMVKEWLLYAVTMAERELGGGTGKIKLRQVYDLFIQRFSFIARFITFNYFSDLVDEALVEMRKLLESNSAVEELVEGSAAPVVAVTESAGGITTTATSGYLAVEEETEDD